MIEMMGLNQKKKDFPGFHGYQNFHCGTSFPPTKRNCPNSFWCVVGFEKCESTSNWDYQIFWTGSLIKMVDLPCRKFLQFATNFDAKTSHVKLKLKAVG